MKRLHPVAICAILIFFISNVQPVSADTSSQTKIHFISLNSTTDAILLESNGHYGMVDSGEDWDYPNSTKYPLRSGITTNIGFEQQVIHYLEKIGVKKLDFYIATHSHSDHIGSGDEILRHFPTERLYINRYDDSYMLDAHGKDPSDPYYVADAKENRLWDNQYVYDCLIQAAQDTGTQIITDLDLEENAPYRSFTLGDMQIDIMNYDRLRDDNGNIIPVSSENNNCLVTKITAYGHVALLTSDMEPLDGDTTKIALQLIDQLSPSDDTSTPGTDASLFDESSQNTSSEIFSSLSDGLILDLPEDRSETSLQITKDFSSSSVQAISEGSETNGSYDEIDDSLPNTGKTISIDLMKMVHHSVDYNNPMFFLTSLNPKTVVVTAPMSWFSDRERSCLPESDVFATASDSAAVVSTFTSSGVETSYTTLTPEWAKIDDTWYYFDKNGRTLSSGMQSINNKLHYFDTHGAAYNTGWFQLASKYYYADPSSCELYTGWHEINGNYYYFYDSGILATNTVINNYYVDSNGVWIPGFSYTGWIQDNSGWWYRYADGTYPRSTWKFIGNSYYYFNTNGYMVTGWLQDNSKWYYLNTSGAMQTGWQQLNNIWYYFDASGKMLSGFFQLGSTKYYADGSGRLLTSGWHLINSTYYYMDASGAIATNTWISNYYVDANGAWIPSKTKQTAQWVASGNRWWYRNSDDSYPRSSWKLISGKWYYFNADGWMVTGWISLNGTWYYLDADGAMFGQGWHQINKIWYYMYSSGALATNTWIDNYYVDANGAWTP